MLAACSNLKEAQMVVSDIIPRLLGPINGCVAVMKESRNQLEVSLDWGGTWPADKVYGTNECWALRKGRYHLSKGGEPPTVLPPYGVLSKRFNLMYSFDGSW